MIENSMTIKSEEMQAVLCKLFLQHNFNKESAALLAEVFTENTLAGVNSHGINRVPLFIKYVKKGLINVNA